MSKQDFAAAIRKQLATLKDGNTYSVAKVQKEAGLIKVAAAKMDVRYHAAAVAALGCIMDHGQATPLADLLNAMGRSTRVKTLAEWAMKHSHVTLEKNKGGVWAAKLVDKEDRKSKDDLLNLLLKAEAEPFWNAEEKTASDFNLGLAIAQLLKRAESAKKKGQVTPEEGLALIELQSMAEKFAPPAANDGATDPLEKVG